MKTCYKTSLFTVLFASFLVFTVASNSYATKHTITVQNYFFNPLNVIVNLGDTIEWKWIGGTHTTTSVTIPAGAAAWDSPIKSTLQTFKYVPTVLGAYNYKCTPHVTTKNMQANFTVVCPTPSISISAGGATTFCKGGSVTLSKNSIGTLSSYQWQLDGADIPGATTTSFNAEESGDYTLIGVNNCGNSATSNEISVTVNKKPKATVTPAGPLTICAGETVVLSVTTGNNLVYQWKNGNANIPGATNPTLDVTAAGDYKCKVTNTNTGCTKTSKVVNVTVTCKAEYQVTDVTVFPNPSTDYFVMNTSLTDSQNGMISIYDLTGKLLEKHVAGSKTLEVGKDLPKGIYFARIETAGEVMQVMKLIKN